MQNLPQGSEIWIAAGVAFILGFLLEWLIARSRRSALVQEQDRQAQTAQRSLKRVQDDLDTVQAQLATQRDRAEELAAQRANAESSLEMAEEARTAMEQKATELQGALDQEVERREAVEALLEQVRSQARELQTSLDASQSELAAMGVRINEEAEARSAAESALAAEALRVSELAEELERLSSDLIVTRLEMEAAVSAPVVAQEPPAWLAQEKPAFEGDVAESVGAETARVVVEDGHPEGDGGEVASEMAALEAAQKRVSELSVSVNALSAMGAELALEVEKRDRENRALRAQLLAHDVEPDLSVQRMELDQAADREAALAALQGELDAARTQNSELEQQMAAMQLRSEQLAQEQAERDEALSADIAATAEAYRLKEEELADAASRIAQLQEQLNVQSEAATAMESALVAANDHALALAAQLEAAQRERDGLFSQKTGMEARLHDRTEEVSALTSATVAAAATIKRRDDALRRAEAELESLRTQTAAAEETKSVVESALAEKDSALTELERALESMRAELAALGEANAEARAAVAEKDASLADALAQGHGRVEELQAQLEELRRDAEMAQAQLASRDERLERLTALVRSVTAGQTGGRYLPLKAAAMRNALSMGVTPGELADPQDFEPLPGIGVAYEKRLYAAGIGTYWELACMSDDDLLHALGLERPSQLRVKPSVARSEAYQRAEQTGTVGMLWAGGQGNAG